MGHPDEFFDAEGRQWLTVGALAKAIGRTTGTVKRLESERKIPGPTAWTESETINGRRRLYSRRDFNRILKVASELLGLGAEDDDDLPVEVTNRSSAFAPVPWEEVVAGTNPQHIEFSDVSGTARYDFELSRVDALIRDPNYGASSYSRRPSRRSDSFLYE